MSELELLRLQAEGSLDERGRVAGLYGIKVACCDSGEAVWIGDEVPEAMAGELLQILARTQPPAALDQCAQILGRPLRSSGGPSYLISEPSGARRVAAASQWRAACLLSIEESKFETSFVVERSDRSSAFRGANPGNWHPIEWNELLDGRLGPWTMALEGERVVSLCHTPGPMTPRAAECGVWTDPAVRGRGSAAAVTSEWAAMLRPTGRHLFYSTDSENLSSQRVAQRLNLRPLGWIWRLGPELDKVHPLSALRRQ
jgi:RimJ/RimL family protein N-acetyltransferase